LVLTHTIDGLNGGGAMTQQAEAEQEFAGGSRALQSPADSRAMQALVSECWRADWPAMHLHAGDVDWWTVHALGRSPGLEERVRLWFTGEPVDSELVAFAWYGPPSDADLIVHPDHREIALLGEMVSWVEAQVGRFGATVARRLGGLDVDAVVGSAETPIQPRIWTVESEMASVTALAGLSFEPSPEPGYVHYCGRMDDLDLGSPALPAGFAFRTITTDADIAARVLAGHAAFPGSTMSAEKYRFCRTTPLYRAALDTFIVAPDGSVAAFALGWLDPLTESVELEPVGVAPEHQRRGLGKAVCRATLRTARELRARQVLIAAEATNPASNALYASLGLRLTARVVALRRRRPA